MGHITNDVTMILHKEKREKKKGGSPKKKSGKRDA